MTESEWQQVCAEKEGLWGRRITPQEIKSQYRLVQDVDFADAMRALDALMLEEKGSSPTVGQIIGKVKAMTGKGSDGWDRCYRDFHKVIKGRLPPVGDVKIGEDFGRHKFPSYDKLMMFGISHRSAAFLSASRERWVLLCDTPETDRTFYAQMREEFNSESERERLDDQRADVERLRRSQERSELRKFTVPAGGLPERV
jgi:hypothetical protein